MTDYFLCGWRVRSGLPLPELLPWSGDDRQPDLTIALGPVPDQLAGARFSSRFLQIGDDDTARFAMPALAAFLIRQGREVVVAPEMDVDAPDIGLFLLGTVFGILCHQRGLVPLHASCVSVDGRAVAISGVSGSGKSTLAAALLQLGHRLLADDVAVIDPHAPGGPVVLPSFPRQKLWQDTLTFLDLPPGRRVRRDTDIEKYEHLAAGQFHAAPMKLAAVCHLGELRLPDDPALERRTGMSALPLISAAVYRRNAAHHLGLEQRLFGDCGRLINAVPQFILRRPRQMEHLRDFAASLPELLRAGA